MNPFDLRCDHRPVPAGRARQTAPATRLAAVWRSAALSAALLAGAPPWARAEAPGPALARALGVADANAAALALGRLPVQQGALAAIDADRAAQRQLNAGPGEWTASVGLARVRDAGPPAARSSDWELGLERPWQRPGKAAVRAAAGDALVAAAQAQARRQWAESARQLVIDLVQWQREEGVATVWRAQADLLDAQRAAVARRQQLGDAAVLEQRQAEAAHTQAVGQAAWSAARAAAARQALQARYRDLPLLPYPASVADLLQGDPAAPGQATAGVVLPAEPPAEVLAARAAAAALEAQALVDAAERAADPTFGVRYARARQGQEHTVALTFSLPLGGEQRRATADLAAARAAVARWAAVDAQARWQADAARRVAEFAAVQAAWHDARRAARQLAQVADQVATGHRLGDGSLADVLVARRLANEQLLNAVHAGMDALQLQALAAVDADGLFTAPTATTAGPVGAAPMDGGAGG